MMRLLYVYLQIIVKVKICNTALSHADLCCDAYREILPLEYVVSNLS